MLDIYKASAGSGKTFRLAYQYIKLLLGHKNPETGEYTLVTDKRNRHRNILAITFTNKATEEMKRRIINELAVLGGIEPGWTKPSPYIDDLTAELQCDEDQLKKAAAEALYQLLFDFNFFQVSTIDSFFQTILRTFAREADLPGSYEVEINKDIATNQGVHDFFESLSINDTPDTRRAISWITQYILSDINKGKSTMLFNQGSGAYNSFLKFINNLTNDVFMEHYDEMMDYLGDPTKMEQMAQYLVKAEPAQLNETRRLCTEAHNLLESRGYLTGSQMYARFMTHLKLVMEAGRQTNGSTTMQKTLENPLLPFNKKLKAQMEVSPDEEAIDAILRACQSLVDGEIILNIIDRLRSNLYVMGLLKSTHKFIDAYRTENNLLYLGDTNTLLKEIIGEDDTPFVYERVGIWLNHFLIDEFQDTSRIQWENLRPLLNEGQSADHDSLIIGDEKQCIYRFRFSDPTLLQQQISDDFPRHARPTGNDIKGNTNWRSSAQVVTFNNKLFHTMAHNMGFDDIYANVRQNISDKHTDHKGYVMLNGITADTTEQFEIAAMELMEREIVRQLSSGYTHEDICVLTRSNPEATRVIDYLMRQADVNPGLKNARIISDDAMEIASAPAVKLIISVLRLIDTHESPESDIDPHTGLPKNKRERLGEVRKMINRYEHIRSLNFTPEEALAKALDDFDPMACNEIVDQLCQMDCFNLPSLVERIIVRYISGSMADKQNMFISAFVDLVTDFCASGSADLHSFLQWWDTKGHDSCVAAPADSNAIRVMTIHKSKGLEFRCVHIPFCTWAMIDFRGLEWFMTDGQLLNADPDIVPPMVPLKPGKYMIGTQFEQQYQRRCNEQLLDELNVLYVAFTRAEDELIISYNTKSKADTTAAAMQQAFDEMQFDHIEISPDPTDLEEEATADSDEPQPDILPCETRTIGTPTTAIGTKAKPRTALTPNEDKISMPAYESSDRDDLWALLDIDRYLDFGVSRERGILLHEVLAHVRHTADIPKAIAHCSRMGHLPKEEAEEVASLLTKRLAQPEVKRWFEDYAYVLCERPLTLPDGKTARPDRVVAYDDGSMDVVDYKFGEERPEEYATQVRGYMNLLAPHAKGPVRGYIFYVDSGVITPVNP